MKEQGLKLGLPEEAVTLLLNRQGKRAKEIFRLIEADSQLKEPVVKDLCFTLAEWQYVIKNEYITTLEDLIRRRFPITLLKKLSEGEVLSLKESANKILRAEGMTELE